MLWLLQVPPPILVTLWVVGIVGLSIGGLVVFRKAVSQTRLENANAVSGSVFQLAGVLYAVLVGFVVVVVWEQFSDAEDASALEASAVTDLLRDSAALPAESRSLIEESLIRYTRTVIDEEFPSCTAASMSTSGPMRSTPCGRRT